MTTTQRPLSDFELHFLQFRKGWYSNRLKTESNPLAKSFLRKTLYNINQQLSSLTTLTLAS